MECEIIGMMLTCRVLLQTCTACGSEAPNISLAVSSVQLYKPSREHTVNSIRLRKTHKYLHNWDHNGISSIIPRLTHLPAATLVQYMNLR